MSTGLGPTGGRSRGPRGRAGASSKRLWPRPKSLRCPVARAPWVIRKVKSGEVWGRNERAKPGGACGWLMEAEVTLGGTRAETRSCGIKVGP